VRPAAGIAVLAGLAAGAAVASSCSRHADDPDCDGWPTQPPATATPPIASLALPPPLPNAPGQPVVRASVPEKLFQLVGDLDRATVPPTPTPLRTESTVGLVGTDLGYPVLHKNRLYLVFGDALPRKPFDPKRRVPDADVIGYVELPPSSGSPPPPPTAAGGIDLRFFLEDDGQYAPVRLGGTFLAGDEVPYSGFSDGSVFYTMFYVGAAPGRSILGASRDDGRTFDPVVDVPTDRIGFVAPLVVATADVPGLAGAVADPKSVLFYARPRQQEGEPLFVFAAPLGRLADPTAWRYYTGGSAWSAEVAAAPGVFTRPSGERCRGPFWIGHIDGLNRWLLVERCLPHHLAFRIADAIVGPWTEPQVLYDSVDDGGLCRFMHKLCDPAVTDPAAPNACCDQDFQPELYCKFGPNAGDVRPYGPGILQPYGTYDPASRTATIYFVMSPNNPYTVFVMKGSLREP
jgi:hypothetical protein